MCQPLNLITSLNPKFFFTYITEQNKAYYSVMNKKNFRTIFKIDFEKQTESNIIAQILSTGRRYGA
jgi:hypothetical protein